MPSEATSACPPSWRRFPEAGLRRPARCSRRHTPLETRGPVRGHTRGCQQRVSGLTREDEYGRGADDLGRYPGVFVANLPGAMSPSVRLEVGRARGVPFVERPVTSFVHEHLDRLEILGEFTDNRPRALRCVHPLVALLEKLDALSRRYGREKIEADTFVRHDEDAARIVRALDRLPPSEIAARTLADDMLAQKDVAALPSADDSSLVLDDSAKRAPVEQAYARIAWMFWGPRIPLDAACQTLRDWVAAMPC